MTLTKDTGLQKAEKTEEDRLSYAQTALTEVIGWLAEARYLLDKDEDQ